MTTLRLNLVCECGNRDDMDLAAPPCSADCGRRMTLARTHDDEGDPTPAEAGRWEVGCVRAGEYTVSNGLRTFRSDYLGDAERLADWLNRAVPAAPAPAYDFAWLIEDGTPGGRYYGGVGEHAGAWTTDHTKAVRYVRREDAERAVMGLPNGWHLIGRAVEHGWAVPAAPAPEPTPRAAIRAATQQAAEQARLPAAPADAPPGERRMVAWCDRHGYSMHLCEPCVRAATPDKGEAQ